jgi:hypothetical protein
VTTKSFFIPFHISEFILHEEIGFYVRTLSTQLRIGLRRYPWTEYKYRKCPQVRQKRITLLFYSHIMNRKFPKLPLSNSTQYKWNESRLPFLVSHLIQKFALLACFHLKNFKVGNLLVMNRKKLNV